MCVREGEQSTENEKKEKKRMTNQKRKEKRSLSMGGGMAHPRTRCEVTSCHVTFQNQAEKG